MTGIEAAEAIRSQVDCHVIFLTGSSDRVNADLADVTKPFGLVLKPIDEEELQAAIAQALKQPSARRPLRKAPVVPVRYGHPSHQLTNGT